LDRKILTRYSENRSRFYSFLSELYLQSPDEKFLEKLTSKISEIDQGIDGVLVKNVMILRDALNSSDCKELAQRLTIEYTRLLRGIKKGYGSPPPYESLLKGEDRVFGKVTREVMMIYQKTGFGTIDQKTGPQDHIGAELKFMSFLCQKESEAWRTDNIAEAKRYLETEKAFLNNHLLFLVSKFTEVIRIDAKEKFYIDAATLTKNYTAMDSENIGYLLTNCVKTGVVAKS
jgi:TorA maturation chaperone TorD